MRTPKVATSQKIDVLEDHLRASAEMIAWGVNPFSTHLVVMATEDLLEHIVRDNKTTLTLEVGSQLTAEGKVIWQTHKRDAYNYLKHAKRGYRPNKPSPDGDKVERLNDITTLTNIYAYRDVTGKDAPYMQAFVAGIGLMYEGIFEWSKVPGAEELRREIGEFSRADFRTFVSNALARSG